MTTQFERRSDASCIIVDYKWISRSSHYHAMLWKGRANNERVVGRMRNERSSIMTEEGYVNVVVGPGKKNKRDQRKRDTKKQKLYDGEEIKRAVQTEARFLGSKEQ